MSLKQQLHIINGTQILKSLYTQPKSKEIDSPVFRCVWKYLKASYVQSVNASGAKHVKHPLSPLLQTWIYILKETKQSLGVRSKEATLQVQ